MYAAEFVAIAASIMAVTDVMIMTTSNGADANAVSLKKAQAAVADPDADAVAGVDPAAEENPESRVNPKNPEKAKKSPKSPVKAKKSPVKAKKNPESPVKAVKNPAQHQLPQPSYHPSL